MSRFEINPNTREPYVQEPIRMPERISAKAPGVLEDNRMNRPQSDVRPPAAKSQTDA
jgi:hypothetical protein